MQPLRLQIVSRALKRASIFLIFNDANGRYDLEKKGDAILMSKIVESIIRLWTDRWTNGQMDGQSLL